jgi:hypothetical protein
MKSIFVIHENGEIITARDTMNHAIAAAMNRLSICGYLCEGFVYGDTITAIYYRNPNTNEVNFMYIEATTLKEGV